MSLKDKATAIVAAKTGFYGKIESMADALKASMAELSGDYAHSEQWKSDAVGKAHAGYEAERARLAADAREKLSRLYGEALAECSEVFAKQPTAGEAAYLQAFTMRPKVKASDVAAAEKALGGNVAATAAMYDHARAHGAPECGSVPSYLRVSELAGQCEEAALSSVASFGAATRQGSAVEVTGGLRMALIAANPGDAFTTACEQVAAFE